VPSTFTVGVLVYGATQQTGEVKGAAPDVARAVLEQLGVSDVKFEIMAEEQKAIVAIAAGAVDMVGGLTVRADLCKNLTFSIPDWVSGTALIVPPGNPKGLTTWDDVKAKGAKVAVMTSLPEEKDAVAAGVPAPKVLSVPTPDQLISAVSDGKADCAAFDDLSARAIVKSYPGGLTTAKPFTPPNRPPLIGAFAFPSATDPELVDSFNNRLRDLHESGDWQSIVAPYGYTEDHAPPPDLTADTACAG
jgi:polar amino acid transport system substrate-binding protein